MDLSGHQGIVQSEHCPYSPDGSRRNIIGEGSLRIATGKLYAGVALAVLAVVLVPNEPAQAQTASRSFQMGMWTYPSTAIPTVKTSNSDTQADTDIQTFYDEQTQPTGVAIVIGLDWNQPMANRLYDWSRIVAVEADEPYDNLGDPCGSGASAVSSREYTLAVRAAELKVIAPWVRFWVNLTPSDLTAMQTCKAALNQPYIDVISMDNYNGYFADNLATDYQWLIDNAATPYQQLALIPGTFCSNDDCSRAMYLQGYFDYANLNNQSCNLSLGPRGVTGYYDGCRVWIVMGWLSGIDNSDNGELYETQISTPWRAEVALPLSPILANRPVPAKIALTILTNYLSN